MGGTHPLQTRAPDQLLSAVGIGYQANQICQLSLLALTGYLPHNDRFGLVAGLSTQFGLW
ncbi:MAG: hypothetical protein QM778_31665 [Myxococcales bacterium]